MKLGIRFIGMALMMTVFLGSALAEDAKEAPEEKKEVSEKSQALAPPKEVATVMADVWCAKMEECAQKSAMGPKECRKVLKKSFLQGFDNAAPGQEIEVPKGTLEECGESIKKDSCQALQSAQTLPGCNFITLLNRS